MLPFIKKDRKSAGISMTYRKPDEGKAPEAADEGLEMVAEDMMKAHAAGDKKALAAALRSAFMILESQPHEEAEHSEE